MPNKTEKEEKLTIKAPLDVPEYTPSNAYWDFLNTEYEKYRPQPHTEDAERQKRLAKIHAISEGLRTLGEAYSLHKGAPVAGRQQNPYVFKALQDYERIVAQDEARETAFKDRELNLKLNALLKDEENRYKAYLNNLNKHYKLLEMQSKEKGEDDLDKKVKEADLALKKRKLNEPYKKDEEDWSLSVTAKDKKKDVIDKRIALILLNIAKEKGDQAADNMYWNLKLSGETAWKSPLLESMLQGYWENYKEEALSRVRREDYPSLFREVSKEPEKPIYINLFERQEDVTKTPGWSVLGVGDVPEKGKAKEEIGVVPSKPVLQKYTDKTGKVDREKLKEDYGKLKTEGQRDYFLSKVFGIPLDIPDEEFDKAIEQVKKLNGLE